MTSLGDHSLQTADGVVVRARHIIRATEAWTARLPGERRTVAPVYSLVVATAPLPQPVWDRIGLADAETFSEHRHVVVYGQRSVDDRLVFGGRGGRITSRLASSPSSMQTQRFSGPCAGV